MDVMTVRSAKIRAYFGFASAKDCIATVKANTSKMCKNGIKY